MTYSSRNIPPNDIRASFPEMWKYFDRVSEDYINQVKLSINKGPKATFHPKSWCTRCRFNALTANSHSVVFEKHCQLNVIANSMHMFLFKRHIFSLLMIFALLKVSNVHVIYYEKPQKNSPVCLVKGVLM